LRIRVKLTILLLVFSLAPLVVVRWVNEIASERLSERIVEQTAATITRRVEHELLGHLRRVAERVELTRARVAMMTRAQGEAFATALQKRGDPLNPPALPTAADFAEGGAAASQLREQPGWPGGGRPPMVSFQSPVFVPPPGGSFEDGGMARDGALLASCVPLLDALSGDIRGGIRSQYICLESGLHMSFPGRGGYPEDFDGRTRPWYTEAVGAGELVWIGPSRDAPTGEMRITCAVPVQGGDGAVLGVTAVDLSLQNTLALLELPPELALGSLATMLVIRQGEAIEVLLPPADAIDGERAWIDAENLIPEDREAFGRVARELREGRDGVSLFAHRSEASLWAFAPVSRTLGVVMIVPMHRVESLVQPVRQDLRTMSQDTLRRTATAGAVVLVAALLAAYGLARTLSRPIRRMADAAEAIAGGDLSARVAIAPRRDEIGKLARAFNSMVPALADRLRLRESVQLANELQQGLLPSSSPEIPGFEVHGMAIYCDETGGDYFDYLRPVQLGEGRFALVIGDVTGHGIPAALIMTSARALLLSHAARAVSAGDLLGVVNESIARDAAQGRFITLAYLELDTNSEVIRAANAGHDPGLVYHAGTGVFDELPLGGLPLGIDRHERYETAEIPWPGAGDILVLGTDGIWESRNPAGVLYGKARLRDLIRRNAHASPRAIGDALLSDLDGYRGNAPRLDDITFVILKRNG
jgi:sigma-B regulation protein RsbU (phosphoserine phosphatase)